MLINIKKTGLWAFKGIHVEFLEAGIQEMKPDKAHDLIENGRAEIVKEEAPKVLAAEEEQELADNAPVRMVDTVEKGRAGWWSVKFEGVEKVIKVKGADDENEAVTLAIAKLEVQ